MVYVYTFFGFLVLFFVAVMIWAIVTDTWRKLFVTQISKMTRHEIEYRLSILSDKSKKCWAPKKKLEYELLLEEHYKRGKK